VPNITTRDVKKRPETIESGSNVLSGIQPDMILKSIDIVLNEKHNWQPPAEHLSRNVSSEIAKIILGYVNE
jgi:UDP-N-acetylglucosamine 2-epimerase (non-hydrolysing)